jgi:hypothetical protein
MSLKDDVKYIKDEISTEEQFLEKYVKVEQFYRKYKLLIIASLVSIVIAFIGINVKDYFDNQSKITANNAYNTLLINPNDAEAQAILKAENETLYTLVMDMNGKSDKNISTAFFKDLAMYSKALESNDMNTLNTLSMDQKFVLKEYTLINKAIIFTNNAQYKEAKEVLNQIPKDSGVSQIADTLRHYLLTK